MVISYRGKKIVSYAKAVLGTQFSPFKSSEKVKEQENLPDAVIVITA